MVPIEVASPCSFKYTIYGGLIEYFSCFRVQDVSYPYGSDESIPTSNLDHKSFQIRGYPIIHERVLLGSWFLRHNPRYSSILILCEPLAHTLSAHTEYICYFSYLPFLREYFIQHLFFEFHICIARRHRYIFLKV